MILKLSTNKLLQSHKPLIKEMFDAIVTQVGTSRMRKALVAAIDSIVEESLNTFVLPAIQRNLVQQRSVFTSTLYNSLRFTSDGPGRVALDAGPAQHYAGILEKGSQPRQIDSRETDNIIRWVIYNKQVDEDTGKSIADKVIRAIEERGNQPHPYIEPALELMMPVVKDVVHQQLAAVLRP